MARMFHILAILTIALATCGCNHAIAGDMAIQVADSNASDVAMMGENCHDSSLEFAECSDCKSHHKPAHSVNDSAFDMPATVTNCWVSINNTTALISHNIWPAISSDTKALTPTHLQDRLLN